MKNNGVLNGDESKNILYYTSGIDHYNHGFGKDHPTTIGVLHATEKNILNIIDFIDENPEFALIVSSDHGGQKFYGEDNFCNHGCQEGDNQGILFLYTKELNDKENSPSISNNQINVMEFAPTVTQILKGINIPQMATSFPQKIFNDCIFQQ